MILHFSTDFCVFIVFGFLCPVAPGTSAADTVLLSMRQRSPAPKLPEHLTAIHSGTSLGGRGYTYLNLKHRVCRCSRVPLMVPGERSCGGKRLS